MPSQATINADKIIKNAEASLKASCVSFPDVMMGCILDEATDLVNAHGYTWDVALAKAVTIYPATRFAANYIYS